MAARGVAKAAVVAALLSTPAVAQGIGEVMPVDCKQDLAKCSENVWPRNSFPDPGVTQSATFANGDTLTCTSRGHNKRRDCRLTEATATQNNAAAPADGAQCGPLGAQIDALRTASDALTRQVKSARADFNAILNESPDQMDQEIARRQARLTDENNLETETARQAGRAAVPRQDGMLDWLVAYRSAQIAGVGLQAARDIFLRKVDAANKQVAANEDQIKGLETQMAGLGCASGAPAANTTGPATPSEATAPEGFGGGAP
jgi:hypothetical protein